MCALDPHIRPLPILPRFTGEDEGGTLLAILNVIPWRTRSDFQPCYVYVAATVFSGQRQRSLIRQVGQWGRSAVQT